jgi:Holliday junction resolvase RusA-like endonuclease
MTVLSFTVAGVPQPQGSAQAFIPKGWTRAIVTSDNKKNKPWRRAVGIVALEAIAQSRDNRPREAFPLSGPVTLSVDFYLARPKSLKAEEAHTKKCDVDKLARSVCDALTGIVYADDSQIDMLVVRKGYAAPGTLPRAEIVVHATTGGLTW